MIAAYEAVRVEKRSKTAVLAAAHRTALIAEHVADQLSSAEIPRGIEGEKAQEAYCREFRDRAAPFLEQARAAYLYCAERAVEFETSTDASQVCEAALARIDPKRWPSLLEFVGEPTPWGESPPRSVGVQLEPPGTDEAAPPGP